MTARSPNPRAKRCTRRRRCTNLCRLKARRRPDRRKCPGAANSIAACPATKYFGVTGAEFSQSRYATDAAAAEAICKAAQATIVVAPATSRWARVLPGVAQRLGGRADTHVTGVAAAGGKISVSRWYYRQRMEGTLTRAQRPWFIGIDPGSQTPCECGAGTASG
jgi:electron transfer flavoprotein alpha subunit